MNPGPAWDSLQLLLMKTNTSRTGVVGWKCDRLFLSYNLLASRGCIKVGAHRSPSTVMFGPVSSDNTPIMNASRYSSNCLSVETLSHSSGEEKSTHQLRMQPFKDQLNMAGVLRKHTEGCEIIND